MDLAFLRRHRVGKKIAGGFGTFKVKSAKAAGKEKNKMGHLLGNTASLSPSKKGASET